MKHQPPWEKKNPKEDPPDRVNQPKSKKLTPAQKQQAQKQQAKASAKKVDNMRASRKDPFA